MLLYSVLTTRGRSAGLREASKEWEVKDLRIILELHLFLGGGVTNMSCFAKMSLIDWELHETNHHVHGHISRATPFSQKSEWDPGNLTNVL